MTKHEMAMQLKEGDIILFRSGETGGIYKAEVDRLRCDGMGNIKLKSLPKKYLEDLGERKSRGPFISPRLLIMLIGCRKD